MDCLSSRSRLWNSIKRTLGSQDAISDSLTLKCEAHPSHPIKVRIAAEDSKRLAKNGGCDMECGKKKSSCQREHRCKKVCHQGVRCETCKEKVEVARDGCSHKLTI
ncbi:Hypothetical predicted protein [Cloeon dipterum]|uniref:Uncharacterized protein n=1 Tax=Cloeon dipterum TaxID=197152 RepID=A0A8S1E5F0_9INSE|nr:Hypothetical predicted protein [Cloeon dipterum]